MDAILLLPSGIAEVVGADTVLLQLMYEGWNPIYLRPTLHQPRARRILRPGILNYFDFHPQPDLRADLI